MYWFIYSVNANISMEMVYSKRPLKNWEGKKSFTSKGPFINYGECEGFEEFVIAQTQEFFSIEHVF